MAHQIAVRYKTTNVQPLHDRCRREVNRYSIMTSWRVATEVPTAIPVTWDRCGVHPRCGPFLCSLRRRFGGQREREAEHEPRPAQSKSRHQFTSMLLSTITFCHLTRSSISSLPNSSGVLRQTSRRMPAKVASSFGSASA